MNILITGGSGLIGRALCNKLKQEHKLIVLTRHPQRAKARLGQDIQLVESLNQWQDLNQFDAVINLAGEPIADKRWSQAQKDRICQSRWQITQTLTDLIKASSEPPSVFISGSAIGIYGRQDAQPIDETFTDYHDEFSHQVCQRWEDIANQVKEITRVCTLRTGIVLSHEGGALKKMLPPFKMGLGGKMASGYQYMSWIHLDDMVAAIRWLLSQDNLHGPFNLTAPHPVTNREFTRYLAMALHRPVLFPMPETVLKVIFGEMSEILIYGQNVIPSKLRESGFEFHYSELEPALADIVDKL
ncbi:TIGR01777 family oxidoreductase [Motilimonas sp. KMU-193]|uniref:TIGR01777 family oxidoreductase n=1 Tax=Motilimonas sp. KMU-193 TaxID=3388668 RepID=UPI00396B3361